uniref:polysaccharide biosynthesis C-terminal domain-containing protein n=1 Tax=Synechocystis salina TaxID=945780 RepID=UPI002240486C|nr:polysaccharide biosynthesis C-terminal domain-containing protein [Synechocystis salina]
MLGLWGLAEPFVLTVFKEQWSPIIPLLLILVPVGLSQSIGSTVGAIYTAKGRTDWMFKWGIIAGLIVIFALIVGLQWGINGVALSYAVVSIFILSCPNYAIPFKLIDLSMLRFFESLWPPFICSLIMLGTILSLKFFLQSLSSAMILGILVPVGVMVYLICSWFINRQQLQEFMNLIGFRIKIPS